MRRQGSGFRVQGAGAGLGVLDDGGATQTAAHLHVYQHNVFGNGHHVALIRAEEFLYLCAVLADQTLQLIAGEACDGLGVAVD